MQQSAQGDVGSASLELSNLATEQLMGIHDNQVPIPDAEKHERVYVPMTSKWVTQLGHTDAVTDCLLALRSCPPYAQGTHDVPLTQQLPAVPLPVHHPIPSILPTAPCVSTHSPQITGQKSSVKPAHQLKQSSGNVTFADYLLASGFANSNFVG